MTKAIFGVLLFGLILQDPLPPEDYPGQREHRQPPPGFYCANHDTVHAKACGCKRMNTGEDCESGPVMEDRACRVWCHPSFCKCPVNCMPEDSEAPAAPEGEHPH